ncbi:MAG: VC0807 family protein [Acidimicrobiales bacterium]
MEPARPEAMAAPGAEEHALGALSPRALAPQILTGGVAPLVAYELARHFGAADASALALSSVPPALAVAAEWVWRRRLNVIGAIALIGIVAGLVSMAFLNGNELLLKMRESVVTGAFGIVCLVTLVGPARPVMFYVGRALAGGEDRSRGAEFDALWEVPSGRRVFTVLTAMWGFGLVLEAGVRALLALELSTGPFLAVTPAVGWVVIGALIYLTVTYVRATRRRTVDAEGPSA